LKFYETFKVEIFNSDDYTHTGMNHVYGEESACTGVQPWVAVSSSCLVHFLLLIVMYFCLFWFYCYWV